MKINWEQLGIMFDDLLFTLFIILVIVFLFSASVFFIRADCSIFLHESYCDCSMTDSVSGENFGKLPDLNGND